MDNETIARILYNMSLDMDYADYLKTAEQEIDAIVTELQSMDDSNMPYLKNVLESIALNNEDMKDWKERQDIINPEEQRNRGTRHL